MKSNVVQFPKRGKGFLTARIITTGFYRDEDNAEERFLFIGAWANIFVMPMLTSLFIIGSYSFLVVAGIILLGIIAGVIKYLYFPYRIKTYFDKENLPGTIGKAHYGKQNNRNYKDAA